MCGWKLGKGDLCYIVAKNLADLCSSLKVELVSNEIRYLAEAISKQRIEGTA